jgi:hypothetical protein
VDGGDGSIINFFLSSCYFIPSVSLWCMSTSPDHFLLVKAITTNIPVNQLARELETNVGNYAGEGNETAGGRYVGDQSMELHSVALAQGKYFVFRFVI